MLSTHSIRICFTPPTYTEAMNEIAQVTQEFARHGHGFGMHGHHGGFFGLLGLLPWLLLLLVLFWRRKSIKALIESRKPQKDTPLDIAKMRFVKGEISEEEYRRIVVTLQDGVTAKDQS